MRDVEEIRERNGWDYYGIHGGDIQSLLAALAEAEAELAEAKATIEHLTTAMSWVSGHDRRGLDHLEEAQEAAAERDAAEFALAQLLADQWEEDGRLTDAMSPSTVTPPEPQMTQRAEKAEAALRDALAENARLREVIDGVARLADQWEADGRLTDALFVRARLAAGPVLPVQTDDGGSDGR